MKKQKSAKIKNKSLRNLGVAAVALILVAAMAIGLIPNDTALAATKTSDAATTTTYSKSLGDNASTEYAGRIWTDKSVFTTDAVFLSKETGSTDSQTVEIGDDDFLVSFSALATSQEIIGSTSVPVDVVFVIDMSSSMVNNTMDNRQTRLYNATVALNNAMKELMSINDYVRVGVVAFNSTSYELLPLDHYSQIDNKEFFTCSGRTITINAKGTNNNTISKTQSTSSGTNIQKGVFTGMNMLATEESTTANINGTEVQRIPAVIMLTDGEPTKASTAENWWNITNESETSSIEVNALQGMKTLMTASYMKDEIDRNYGGSGTTAATVYSIGMGITDIRTNDTRDLAYATISPSDTTLKNKNSTYVSTIKNAWGTYAEGGTPSVDNYTFKHPTENDIIPENKAIDGLYYVDKYYDADDAETVTEVFEDIVSNISISAAEVPTEHDAQNPMTTGYITYTDPIGEYMEVKEMKSIIYAGVKYDYDEEGYEGVTSAPVENEDSSTTVTYKFKQTAEGNAVYGSEELEHIWIGVTTTTDDNGIKSQVLTIKIPASLIPIRVNSVTLDSEGDVTSHTNNSAYPIRVLYTVGLQDALKTEDGNVKTELLSNEYIAKNSNEDGKIDFYSNLYTGTNVVNGSTAGDATVTFKAASTNPFYYMQEDTPIYLDEACTTIATEIKNDDTPYYYRETYYHALEIKETAISRTGKQLLENTVVIQKTDGWYRPAGTPRVNRMLEFEGTKTSDANVTGTAQDFYSPTYDGTTGYFKVYLGNNGKMSVAATGTLAISKTVTADEGLTAPDKEFTFTVNLNDANNKDLTGEYSYTVTKAGVEGTARTGTVSNGETIKLKAGETATIVNLPPNTKYEVSEETVAGFTAAVPSNASGTITAGTITNVDFTNNYSVESLTFEDGFSLKKILSGRDWRTSDKFAFIITAEDNAPLPDGVNKNGVYTLSAPKTTDNTDGQEISFDFGSITYTKPGTYDYTIYELTPGEAGIDRIAGISYTRELYEITVTVIDDGDGTMSAHAVITKVRNATGDTISETITNNVVTFTNTYSATSVMSGPVATKTYTDHSGGAEGFKNLADLDGEFQFAMVPVTENAPMPDGTVTGAGGTRYYLTSNAEGSVSFGQIKFTEELIGEYEYTLHEIKGNNTHMTYDETVITAKVKVEEVHNNDGTAEIKATWTYYDAAGNPLTGGAVFNNSYDPADATVTITGTKTLTGRDMEAGEFKVTLTPTNALAEEVIRNTGVSVNVPAAADGNPSTFDFGEITFSKVGTYTFTVTETVPDNAKNNVLNGITYDTHECTVTVTVTDTDKNGELEASVSYSDGTQATFNNTYKATFTGDPISLEGTKELTGRPITDGDFYFVVAPQNGAPVGDATLYEGKVYVPVTADTDEENGTYASTVSLLSNVTYTKAGEYSYVISEEIPTGAVTTDGVTVLDGVTYDTSYYTVTVTVSDDGLGRLTAKITKITKNGGVESEDSIVIQNTYNAEDAEYEVRDIQKVLSVFGENATELTPGAFSFVRTVAYADGSRVNNGEVVLYKADGTVVSDEDIVTNDADGTVDFGKIKFTKPGKYVVTIKEITPENYQDGKVVNGITYDTHIASATFDVFDDLKGNLKVEVIARSGSYQFVNKYTATGSLEGSTNLKVTKNLDLSARTEKSWTSADTFTFTLDAYNETKQAVTDGKVKLPKTTTITISDTEGTNADTNTDDNILVKTNEFGNITFYEPGTYSFVIYENEGTQPGMDYDGKEHIITVVVTDNGDGSLEVSLAENSQGNPSFTNIYNPNDAVLIGHGNLHVNKVFTGRPNDEWLATDSFTFTFEASDRDNDAAKAAIAGLADNSIILSDNDDSTTDTDLTQMSLTVTSANQALAHFGDITFTKAGTYEFVIKEVVLNDKIKSVTYDSVNARIVTIEVTSNTNEQGEAYLKASINYDSSDEEDSEHKKVFTFTNTYEATPATETLEVTKNISGRNWLAEDIFSFVLRAYKTEEYTTTADALRDDIIIFSDENESTTDTDLTEMTRTIRYEEGDTNNSKKATFGPITFKEEGEYIFVVEEIVPEDKDKISGMEYDTTPRIVTVIVEDNDEGQLNVASVTTNTDMTWTNTYTPKPIEVSLEGIKTIDGRDMSETDIFGFHIVARTRSELAQTALPENTYVQNAAPDNNTAAITFGPISLSQAGTYEYIIYEGNANGNGITIDTGYVIATVKVGYNSETGELYIAEGYPTYQKVESGVAGETTDTFEFTNTYNATGILDGSTNLKVTKNFTGRALNEWLESDSFTFTLEIDDTNNAYDANNIILPNNASGITISYTDSVKEKAFGDITFTKEGTYQFIVTESKPETTNGIKYDGALERTITVEVVDNHDGTMTATVKEGSATLVFNNTYDTAETTIALSVEKQLNGRDWIENVDSYSFTLAPDTSHVATKQALGSEQITMPTEEEGKIATITSTSKDDSGKYTASFGVIKFKKPGIYRFTVTENVTDENKVPGVTYDGRTKHIYVQVTDNNNGTMTASVMTDESDDVVFVNTYDAADAAPITITAKKEVNVQSGDYALRAGDFKFELLPIGNVQNDPVSAAGIQATNDVDGKIEFKDITYTAAGTYTYKLYEINEGTEIAGIDYDGSHYHVIVQVMDDPMTGKLQTSVSYEYVEAGKNTETSVDSDAVKFTNIYNPADATATIGGLKTFTDVSKNVAKDMEAGQFTFKLTPTSEVAYDPVSTDGITTTNGKLGTFTFATLKYEHTGEYVYQITEVKPNETDNITYSNAVYYVKVVIKDNGGVLQETITYYKDEVAEGNEIKEDNVIFANTYKPTALTTTISGTKTLTGRNWFVGEEGDAFEIQLIGYYSGQVLGTVTVSNDTATKESVAFELAVPAITKAGEYKLVVKETNAGQTIDGVTYDATSYVVTLVVVDNNGKLELKETYINNVKVENGEPNITLTNTYEAAPTKIQITANKTVEGGYTLQGDEFSFKLTPNKDNDANDPLKHKTLTATNDGSGKIVFETITYKTEGEYEYTLTEDANKTVTGITNDSSTYSVKVVVKDNGTGELVTSVTVNEKTVETTVTDGMVKVSTGVTFKNTYKTPEVSITKTQALGTAPKSDDFKTILVREGNIVTYQITVSNASGTVDTAKNVTITDEIPTGLTLVENSIKGGSSYTYSEGKITWVIDSLPAGKSANVSFQVEVPDVTKDTTWTNKATVVYGNTTKPSNEVEITEGVPNVSFEKTQSVNNGKATADPQAVKSGDEVTYTITVTNSGTEAADNVIVTDKVPEGLIVDSISNDGVYDEEKGTITWKIGTVDAKSGETDGQKEVSFKVTVPVVTKDTTWANVATGVYDNDPDGSEPEPTNSVVVFDVSKTLAGVKTFTEDSDSNISDYNGEFSFKLEAVDYVENGETVTQAKDTPMPEKATATNDENGVVTFGKIQFNKEGTYAYKISEVVGELSGVTYDDTVYYAVVKVVKEETTETDADENTSKEVSYKVESTTYHKESLTGDLVEAFKFVNAYYDADVEITKTQTVNGETGTPLTVVKGDKVTYTLTVKNNGKGVASNVVITDKVPAGLIVDEKSISDNGVYDKEKGTITWNMEDLAANASDEVSFQVTVPSVKEDTSWKNVATVTYDNPDGDPDKDDDEVVINEGVPEVTVQKVQSLNDGSKTDATLTVVKGDKVTYYLTVTNTGSGEAKDIVLKDVVPTGLVVDTINENGTNVNGTITWNIASLAAGASKTVSFTVTVPSVTADEAGEAGMVEWKNTATVKYSNDPEDPDGKEEPKSSNTVIVKEGVPVVVGTKTQSINGNTTTTDRLAVKKGDTITYYITVKNVGTGVATDVVVIDVIPEGLELVDGSITNGGKLTDGTIVWKIGELAGLDADSNPGTVTVSFSVVVPGVDEETTWSNTATVDYTNDPEDPDDEKDPEPTNSVEVYEEVEVIEVVPTGDGANIAIYISVVSVALAGILFTLSKKRRVR